MSEKVKTPLRKLREARGMTQAEVSTKVGIDQASYNRIENNEAKPADRVALITKFFGSAITEEQILYPERFPDYAVLPEHVQ